jgi:hypothetical protein
MVTREMFELRDWEDAVNRWGHEMCPRFNEYARRQALYGAENDPVTQAASRAGEIVACLGLGLDPDRELLKEPLPVGEDRPHFDLRLGYRRADVKQTMLHYQYLIWPLTKVLDYATRRFDLLILAKIDYRINDEARTIHSIRGHLYGWMTKDRFQEKKRIANDMHPHLDAGTWYVQDLELGIDFSRFEGELDLQRHRGGYDGRRMATVPQGSDHRDAPIR